MQRTRERVVFGHMHEDHAVELRAAGESADGEALVIASGGDLALALVGAGMRVLAVDTNPAQIALVRLKIAVARAGGPDRAAGWMTGDAREALDIVPAEECARWVPHASSLRHGLCFCGRVDRALGHFGPAVRWAFDWPRGDPGALRRGVRRVGAQVLRLLVAAVHGRAVAERVDAAAVELLERRFEESLARDEAWSNPLRQALLGHGFGERPPRVWTREGITAWLRAADHLRLETRSLDEALDRQPPGSLALVSMSNLPDLTDVDASALLDRAARALAPGGRLVARSMLSERFDWRHDAFDEEAPPDDQSPLCPVVWIGRRR